MAAAGAGGSLYTVEQSGQMYVTDPSTGRWQAKGAPQAGGTRLLVGGGSRLFAIDGGGGLFELGTADGNRRRLGKAGDWRGSLSGSFGGGALYTVEAGGAVCATDVTAATWRAVATVTAGRFVFATPGGVYVIDQPGNLHLLDGAAAPAPPVRAAGAAVSAARPGPVGDPKVVILGAWVGDPDAMLADPAMKVVGTGNEKMVEALVGMLGSARIEITRTDMVFDLMGEKSPPVPYRVLSVSGRTVSIESTDAGENKPGRIEVVDADHIKLVEPGKAEKALYLKRSGR